MREALRTNICNIYDTAGAGAEAMYSIWFSIAAIFFESVIDASVSTIQQMTRGRGAYSSKINYHFSTPPPLEVRSIRLSPAAVAYSFPPPPSWIFPIKMNVVRIHKYSTHFFIFFPNVALDEILLDTAPWRHRTKKMKYSRNFRAPSIIPFFFYQVTGPHFTNWYEGLTIAGNKPTD